jgi:hypothetical protein
MVTTFPVLPWTKITYISSGRMDEPAFWAHGMLAFPSPVTSLMNSVDERTAESAVTTSTTDSETYE